jgi:glycerophosphoryl diester phosphodiesterase
VTHFNLVKECYSSAWRRRNLIVPVYVALRLAAYAVIVPLLGVMINLGVSLSDQSALTDQDIARFLLTPTGFVVCIGLVSILLLNEVLSLAVMTAFLRAENAGAAQPVRAGLAAILMKSKPLILFSILLVLRVTFIAVPFLLACLLAVGLFLSEFDINYYLSARPPEFYKAAAIIIPLLLVMGWLLLSQLSAWALSLHFVVFGETSPRGAFGISARSMAGDRTKLIGQIAIWVVLRVIAMSALALVFGLAIGVIPIRPGTGLRTALVLILVLAGFWMLLRLVVAGVSVGALAKLLNRHFDKVGGGASMQVRDMPKTPAIKNAVLAIIALVPLGLISGALLLDRVTTTDSIEIIAHRGAAGSRPENTLASVRKGIEDRADWIEIDVQETADGDIVVMHDSDLMKLAGVDLKIWDATLEDLEKIDIGSWFDPAYGDQRTPLLRDVLELAKGKSKVLIELKYYGHDIALEERVARVVEDMEMQDQVAIMSLKYPAIQKMQELRPTWRTGVLAASSVGNTAKLDGDFIAISQRFASTSLIRATQNAGKDIYVWTVNDPLNMSKMISKGVNGLITDEPALVHQVLAFRAGLSTPERLLLWLSEVLGLEFNTKAYRDDQP